MISFVDNDYFESYTYDNVGNMLTKGINEKITNYSYNVGNQLTEEITNGQTIGYIYNANGDLTEKTTGEKYTYDIQEESSVYPLLSNILPYFCYCAMTFL